MSIIVPDYAGPQGLFLRLKFSWYETFQSLTFIGSLIIMMKRHDYVKNSVLNIVSNKKLSRSSPFSPS